MLPSLMRNNFPKRPSGAPLHTLSRLYDVPVGFVTPPYFGVVYCFICGRRRVAVARYRMICLVLKLHVKSWICKPVNRVSRVLDVSKTGRLKSVLNSVM